MTLWSKIYKLIYWVNIFNVLKFANALLNFYNFRYAQDEEAADDQEETGWKYIHGDVFRFPKYKSLFAAALGSGTQLFTL